MTPAAFKTKWEKLIAVAAVWGLFADVLRAEPPRPINLFPPVLPPIADADPSDRHPLSIVMPTKVHISRDGDFVTVAPADFEELALNVGKNMCTGSSLTITVSHGSETRHTGGEIRSGLNWKPDTRVYSREMDKLPKGEFTVEYTLTLFETDLPAQHLWNPQGGKAYKVLWSLTFKELVK